MGNVKIFAEGTENIKKNDISKDVKIVIIPHSVKYIEDDAFYGVGCDVFYVGTIAEFNAIRVDNDISTPCVNCIDGLIILHI